MDPLQIRILLYLPSACALLSLTGSCLNIRNIIHRIRNKQKFQVYHRLVLMMSFFDVLSSTSFSLANVPVPSGTRYAIHAFGTEKTCTAQGFFNVLGISMPYYNASLSVYFLLKVRFGKKEHWVRRKAEVWMHIIPCLATFTTAILGFHFGVYNFSGNRCFLSAYPYGCQRNTRITCIRGGNIRNVHYMFYGGIVLLFFIVLFSMTSLFLCIYQSEKKAMRWHFPRSEAVFDAREKARRKSSFTANYRELRHLKHSRTVARQALLYVSSFFLCYVWSYAIAFVSEKGGRPPFFLFLLFYIFYPLQGFFNFVIYTITHQNRLSRSSNSASAVSGTRRSSLNPISFLNRTKLKPTDVEKQQQDDKVETSISDKTKHLSKQQSPREYYGNGKQEKNQTKKRLSVEGTKMLTLVAAAIEDLDEIDDDDDLFIEEIMNDD